MMKHTYFLFTGGSFLLAILMASCNLYNPPEKIPSYIHIESISLTTNPVVEGTSSSKITDAWVYVDGQLIGAFELPATLPVLYQGTHEIMIKAGIKVNGIAATRAPYPFYENYKQTVDLVPAAIVTMSPVVHYVSNADWSSPNSWIEDFEGTAMTLDTSFTGTNAGMTIATGTTNPVVFEGHGAGVVYLNHQNTNFEYMSTAGSGYFLQLPHGDSPVFLELNYKCNHDFTVGVFAGTGSTTTKLKVIDIHSSADEWKKIYVYMSPTINNSAGATDFTIFFGMLNSTQEDGIYLALDNIKLLHY